eukprot:55002_1
MSDKMEMDEIPTQNKAKKRQYTPSTSDAFNNIDSKEGNKASKKAKTDQQDAPPQQSPGEAFVEIESDTEQHEDDDIATIEKELDTDKASPQDDDISTIEKELDTNNASPQ